jgi:hypothetical protein
MWHPYIDVTKLPFAVDYRRIRPILGSYTLGTIEGIIKSFQRRRYIYPGSASSRKKQGLKFNSEALSIYIKNLELIRLSSIEAGAKLAVIIWPALLNQKPYPSNIDDLLVTTFNYYPLSLEEFEAWYRAYKDATLSYTVKHPEVLVIDPTGEFKASPDRNMFFVDIAHLTEKGDAVLADTVIRYMVSGMLGSHS